MNLLLVILPALVGAIVVGVVLFKRKKSAPPGPGRIGIVMHEDTAGDLAQLAALGSLGHLPRVRTTNYGDPDSAARILALLNAGHEVLSIVPFGKGYGPVGTGMAIQLDNEPDVQSPAVSPEHYGETFRFTMHAMRQSLPSTIPIVTAGFSNNASADWIARALAAGAADADAICFHVYGDDLVEAFHNRMAVITQAIAAASVTKPLWITEVGFPAPPVGPSEAAQSTNLQKLLALPELRVVERVYVYALETDELADFYGICRHDLSRTPRPAFSVVQAAMAKP